MLLCVVTIAGRFAFAAPVAEMACAMLRTRCFAGASTARAAQPTRAVRMVVRASAQQQPKQLPSIVKPAIVSAFGQHYRKEGLNYLCTAILGAK